MVLNKTGHARYLPGTEDGNIAKSSGSYLCGIREDACGSRMNKNGNLRRKEKEMRIFELAATVKPRI